MRRLVMNPYLLIAALVGCVGLLYVAELWADRSVVVRSR
jgi:hypothetical protein